MDRTLLVVIFVAVTIAGVISGPALGIHSPTQGHPAVDVAGDEVNVSASMTVPITLTSAPDGLSGYELRVSVETKSVANITGASYPDHFALTEDPVISEDNATVRLKAVDLSNETTPGETDVALASITVKGVRAGNTTLSVTVIQMDDDAGGSVDPEADPGYLSVTSPGTESDRDSATRTPTPTPVPTATTTSVSDPTETAQPASTPIPTPEPAPSETTKRDGGSPTSEPLPSPTSSPLESPPTATVTESVTGTGPSPTPQSSSGTLQSPGSATLTPLPTPSPAGTPIETSVRTGATETSGQPGFGAVSALLALGVLGLFAGRYQN